MMEQIVTNEFSFILKPSTIPGAGIGVFSTHLITKGSKIKFSPPDTQPRRLKGSDIPELFKVFCIAEEDDWYRCPAHFNRMEIGWFINHSIDPNIEWRDGAWYTLKQIEANEEIFVDYNTLGEPTEKREAYYQNKHY